MRMARALAVGLSVTTALAAGHAHAAECRSLRYTFQPDCYRSSLDAACDKAKTGDRLDLGPQVAVWLQQKGGGYVETLMVTNLVALRGIGNRPGYWKFPSAPKFPYGKRPMALPIWAHARGKLYDTVLIQNKDSSYEKWLGFHEMYSSPDPYFCRPMSEPEIDVDAVSCPTKVFNSAKGKLVPKTVQPQSYYPPRADLLTFNDRDCDEPSNSGCTPSKMSARAFAEINDLDSVAAATPPYGRPFRGVWNIPTDLPDGDYEVMLEVSKEFDNNQSHGAKANPEYLAYQDPNLSDSGMKNNFGQPSVLFRVPIRIESGLAHQSAASDIVGVGSWNGANGDTHPHLLPTISDTPGSGKGRLLVLTETFPDAGDPLTGRLLVRSEPRRQCEGASGTGQVSGLEVPKDAITPEQVEVRFIESDDGGKPVEQYEIRYRQGTAMTAADFDTALPAGAVNPTAPGRAVSFQLNRLQPSTDYVLGVRARGCCIGVAPLVIVPFRTAEKKFKQLEGCFVATAAYGSAMQQDVDTLRRFRNRAKQTTAMASAAVQLYERASPPAAQVLAGSDEARALVRTALAPVVDLLRGVESLTNSSESSTPRKKYR
jgi:hypothetical protein